ncbi:hypothetical protein BTM25_30300 [Actinomadura rubteroloni]|uniref:Uncharacterized protein n=1 Tax=Actinomadura rubteroloni TaxID=1926885 RepID=A0A2P4UH88_9ACTN|nr:hypothetical protein BTM25_30300 [Actinomadura rubteroloni]
MEVIRGLRRDGESPPRKSGVAMTPTARWAAAQRRKREIINRTVLDRALHDPRRVAPATTTAPQPQK